jgi:hypothetical protein
MHGEVPNLSWLSRVTKLTDFGLKLVLTFDFDHGGVSALCSLTSLAFESLHASLLRDDFIRQMELWRLPLRKLHLHDCGSILHSGWLELARITSLEELHFPWVNTSESPCKAFLDCVPRQSLVSLTVGSEELSDNDVLFITSSFTKLTQLRLHGAPNITDTSLVYITALESLQALSVNGRHDLSQANTFITLSPHSLITLSNLTELDLQGVPSVSAEHLASVADKLPLLRRYSLLE